MPPSGDLLIKNAHQVVTCEPDLVHASDPEGGSIGLIEDGSVLVSAGRIEWVGRDADPKPIPHRRIEEIDATGTVVLPGLIDSHTHSVFMGTREREYALRVSGVPYMEIARRGGGINSTVRDVRKASIDELVSVSLPRLESMLRNGTTTVEIKSGYGLELESEIKMLEAIGLCGKESRLDVVSTFLGAHEIPSELKENRNRYIDMVIEDMIPAVAERGLAEFCDVFCEKGVFTAEEARRVLLRGKEHGLKPKIHADEFADSGGAGVAGDVGAVSAGHLGFASHDGLEAMRQAGTVAILLPGVSFGLGRCEFADAREMIELGLEVAIATDFNPGSSMVDSLLIVSSIACSFMKMTASEVILGITKHAAKAVGRGDSIGTISPGKKADFVLFRIPDFRYIPYHLGGDIVMMVVKDGELVYARDSRPSVKEPK